MATAPKHDVVQKLQAEVEELRRALTAQLSKLEALQRATATLASHTLPANQAADLAADLRGSVLWHGDLTSPTGEAWNVEK